jgi:ectoine hydroxylase-related dioxygenase (phytanoyl-CoA dioxygenase family)
MTTLTPSFEITASGHALDTSPEAFGELRDSSEFAFDAPTLRERLDEDGYLFLPGLLNRDEVLDARRVVTSRLQKAGHLLPGTDPMDCIADPACTTGFNPDLALDNPELMRVLYSGPMIEFYERLLGEPVRHFDFTWFRATSPGASTPAHTDAVYMNRGTQNLFTSWTPIGDVSLEMGGLMMLEGSHKHEKLRANYSSKDVDKFCENKVGANYTKMGGGGNIREGGWLSNAPHKLQKSMGGRWLTAPFRAGDLLMFSIFTVHASMDNQSNRIRLSSDSRYQRASEPADERWVGANPIGHGAAGKRGMIC